MAAPPRLLLSPAERTTTPVTPSDDDIDLAHRVQDMFQTARAARAPMKSLWDRCYRAVRAKPPLPTSGDSQSIKLPEIWPIVRAAVGWKLDQRIVTQISPATAMGTEWRDWLAQRCEDMELVLESSGWVNHEEMELEKILWSTETYGTGIAKTTWDPVLAGGLGDALISYVNPYCFYPDPAATNEHDGDYYIEARIMSLQELDRRFPGQAKKFSAGGGMHHGTDEPPSQLGAPSSTIPRVMPNPISPGVKPLWSRTGTSGRPDNLNGEPVVVLECWLREHNTDDDGKVTDGWRVIMVAGDVVLLNEKATDLWSHGWHPYDRYVDHDLGEFWGIGLVELLGPAQAALNRIIASVERNIAITGDPILLEDTKSRTHGATIAPKPGQRLTKRQGTEVTWLTPPSLHPSIGDLIQFLLDRMKVISGLNDVPGGGLQGRPAAETAGMLAEAQFISIRSQLINLEHFLSGANRKKVSLIAENYTEPRWLSQIGPDGKPTPLMLGSRHFMKPTPDEPAPLEYSVRIDAGSSSHTSRKVREDRAIALFGMKALDNLSLLESLDWPNPAEVMERLGLQESSILAATSRDKARAR